jgi:hypothetical protein
VDGCPLCLSTLEALEDRAGEALAEWRQPVPLEAFSQAACPLAERVAERVGAWPAGADDPRDDPPAVRGTPEQLGNYRILGPLGWGGMGNVYQALNTHLGTVVALKVLAPDRRDDPQAVARFGREMRTLARLTHPNIVRALDGDCESFRWKFTTGAAGSGRAPWAPPARRRSRLTRATMSVWRPGSPGRRTVT